MAQAGDVIENPVTGQRLVFQVTSADSDGELFAAEGIFPPGYARQEVWEHSPVCGRPPRELNRRQIWRTDGRPIGCVATACQTLRRPRN